MVAGSSRAHCRLPNRWPAARSPNERQLTNTATGLSIFITHSLSPLRSLARIAPVSSTPIGPAQFVIASQSSNFESRRPLRLESIGALDLVPVGLEGAGSRGLGDGERALDWAEAICAARR